MSVIRHLIKEFSRLPGVGSKTAQRFGYHLLKRPREEAFNLAAAIRELAQKIGPCEVCGNFTESTRCEICANPNRDGTAICVVEEAYEVGASERAGGYRGQYHVLGGRLSPLDELERRGRGHGCVLGGSDSPPWTEGYASGARPSGRERAGVRRRIYDRRSSGWATGDVDHGQKEA